MYIDSLGEQVGEDDYHKEDDADQATHIGPGSNAVVLLLLLFNNLTSGVLSDTQNIATVCEHNHHNKHVLQWKHTFWSWFTSLSCKIKIFGMGVQCICTFIIN